jgi:glycosyltransferase involved in cell wall biosynthesis
VDWRALFLQRVPTVIANPRAAARMLALRCNYRGNVVVCRNARRPRLRPTSPVHKEWPRQRPLRLGLAGRLTPVKGMALALHALKLLRADSLDAELHIAGAGRERESLRELAVKLDIASWVHFHGVVSEMHTFYGAIDCLLHPALREPFGLVAIEAAARGCPVIAAAVDGLPEAVLHGVSGFCIPPQLPLGDYPALGGSMYDLPDVVYDPRSDALSPPRLVDPRHLADAVTELFSTRGSFVRLSRSAGEVVPREFDFGRHVDEVLSVLGRALGRAGGSACKT